MMRKKEVSMQSYFYDISLPNGCQCWQKIQGKEHVMSVTVAKVGGREVCTPIPSSHWLRATPVELFNPYHPK